MSFHISRWRYWWAYLIVFLLVLAAIWLTDNGKDIASWTVGIFALVLFVIFEFVIRLERVVINNSVEIRRFRKETTSIPFSSISNVTATQTTLQHLLRYGDVIIKSSSGEVLLSNFEEPVKIEKLISQKIKAVHESHEH